MGDEPPYLAVGTEVSAKYKGAFCEAKIRKVVRSVKCKVIFKQGLGTITVADDQIKGQIRNGAVVEVKHPEKKEVLEATIAKVQDCSQYTVVFDDGDITTLRRTALCLKSGRHFAESETLDQLPLTHPEHFSNPVIGGRRGRRSRLDESSEDEEAFLHLKDYSDEKEEDIGRVVCVEGAEKKKQKDNWFPGLVVAPTAQDTVAIDTRLEYLVRSFKDGRYYTVPKKEALEFTREIGLKVENSALKTAVEKALQFLDKDELPPHWDRDSLFGLHEIPGTDSEAGFDCESSDDEPREEKDHFVAQLYKFMDDSGTPINKGPTICNQDIDLYRLFKVVQNLGGFNRVTNHNNWKIVSNKMGFGQNPATVNSVKQSYKKFLYSFEEFYRKLGCTMVNHPRTSRTRNRSSRSLIRDKDKAIVKTEPKTDRKDKPDVNTQNAPPSVPVQVKVEVVDPNYEIQPIAAIGEKPQASVNFEEVKIKQEPVDDIQEVKVDVKENKKTRQKKIKNTIAEQAVVKNEPPKEPPAPAPKEKKRRLFTRGKREREKTPAVKKPTIPSVTRQKRSMKEKMKAIVDHLKMRTTKFANSALGLQDNSEKVAHAGKNKIKEEITIPKIKKEKEGSVPTTTGLEERRKGRRRKDKTEMIVAGAEPFHCSKAISVGDKLKVYYGPKHDLKVTYEAKVLSIRQEGSNKMYLVHYYGWNTRYDEWIRHSRIADNMSAGRSTKRSQQAARGGRKRSTQAKIGSDTSLKSDSDIIDLSDVSTEVKSDTNNVPPIIVRAKGTRTRSSNKRVTSISENEEYESDVIVVDVESGASSKKEIPAVPDLNGFTPQGKRSRKRKSTECEEKDRSEDEFGTMNKSQKQKRKPCKKPEVPECVTSHTENKSEDIKNVPIKVEIPSPDITSAPEETSKKFQGFAQSSDEEDFTLYIAEDDIDVDGKSEVTVEDVETYPPKGRDFDLNEIRSELKGIESAVGSGLNTITIKQEEVEDEEEEEEEEQEVPEEHEEEEEEDHVIAAVNPKIDNVPVKQEVEDVYEFKEPEPFEFESRKLDDKNKLQRRSLNRYIDENKLSPQRKRSKLCLSPSFSSRKLIIPDNASITIKKEVESPEHEFEAIETSEENFDKVCASPLRAANEDVPLLEEQVVNDHVEDNLDDDSQDRLVISEKFSDNESNSADPAPKTEVFEKAVETAVATVSDVKNDESKNYTEVKKEKEDFNKEDWKDEVEDEELNVAIQRVINQDSSDDTNDGEVMKINASAAEKPIQRTNVMYTYWKVSDTPGTSFSPIYVTSPNPPPPHPFKRLDDHLRVCKRWKHLQEPGGKIVYPPTLCEYDTDHSSSPDIFELTNKSRVENKEASKMPTSPSTHDIQKSKIEKQSISKTSPSPTEYKGQKSNIENNFTNDSFNADKSSEFNQFDVTVKHTIEPTTKNIEHNNEICDSSRCHIETEIVDVPSEFEELSNSPPRAETIVIDAKEITTKNNNEGEGECIIAECIEEGEDDDENEMPELEGAALGLDVTEVVAEVGVIEETTVEEGPKTIETSQVEGSEEVREADEIVEAEDEEEEEEEEEEDEEEEDDEDDDLEEVVKQDYDVVQYPEDKSSIEEEVNIEKIEDMPPSKEDDEQIEDEEEVDDDEEEDEGEEDEEEEEEDEKLEEVGEKEEEEEEDNPNVIVVHEEEYIDDEEVDEKEEEIEEEKDDDEEDEEEDDDEDEEEENLMSLLCDEEIIPGSPNPQSEIQDEGKNIVVVTDIDNDEEIPLSEKLKETHSINRELVKKDAEDNSPPASPESSGSSISSPLPERTMSPSVEPVNVKNNSNSEYEIESASHKGNSEDGKRLRLETRLKKSEGRACAKKGRRPRKRSQETGKRKYSRSTRHHASDSDDAYDSPRMSNSRETLHRPSRSGKYNFVVKLDPEMDSNQRIALIQQSIQQLRRTYADVKAELAMIDRRRKKLRRRERENASGRFH